MILLAALVVCAAGVWLKLGGEAPQARRSPPEARARGGQWPPDIDQGAFQEFALAPGGRSLIMFYSHDCGVCRLAMPAFQRLHQASNGLYRVGLVDIRRSPNLALRWSIRGVPTFMAFQDGAEVATVTGAPGEDPEAIFLGLSEFARRSFR
jgi:thioredoxin 1